MADRLGNGISHDPLTDIAILMQHHAPTRELEDVLLRSWLGGPPDCMLRARLILMRQMTRLYYAGILLAASIAAFAPVTDLSAPAAPEFRALIASGLLKMGTPEMKLVLGKVFLADFLGSLTTPDFEDALAAVQRG